MASADAFVLAPDGMSLDQLADLFADGNGNGVSDRRPSGGKALQNQSEHSEQSANRVTAHAHSSDCEQDDGCMLDAAAAFAADAPHLGEAPSTPAEHALKHAQVPQSACDQDDAWLLDAVAAAANAEATPRARAPPAAAAAAAASVAAANHVMREEFSGLRLKTRDVGMLVVQSRMAGRTFVALDRVPAMAPDAVPAGDWVTIGVLGEKAPAKLTANGKKFCVWKLSDLARTTISVFLFDGAFDGLYSMPLGAVIALLNPDVLKAMHGRSERALSLTASGQVMRLGTSLDLGLCAGLTRAGARCGKPCNSAVSAFCDYHVTREYQRTRSQRPELNGASGMAHSAMRDVSGSNTGVFQSNGNRIREAPIPLDPHAHASASKSSSVAAGAASCALSPTVHETASRGADCVRACAGLGPAVRSAPLASATVDAATYRETEPTARAVNGHAVAPGRADRAAHLAPRLGRGLAYGEPVALVASACADLDSAAQLGYSTDARAAMPARARAMLREQLPPDCDERAAYAVPLDRSGCAVAAPVAAPVAAAVPGSASAMRLSMLREREANKSLAAVAAATQPHYASLAAAQAAARAAPAAAGVSAAPKCAKKAPHPPPGAGAGASPADRLAAALGRTPVALGSAAGQALLAQRSHHATELEARAELERAQQYDEMERLERVQLHAESVMQREETVFYCKDCNSYERKRPDACRGHTVTRVKAMVRWFLCSLCGRSVERFNEAVCVLPCSTPRCKRARRWERVSATRRRAMNAAPTVALKQPTYAEPVDEEAVLD